MNKQISYQEFSALLNQKGVVLLDVRSLPELKQFGVIDPNQVHIDVYASEGYMRLLQLDKSTTYAIYCFHGNRSAQARELLAENGFENVVDLAGGIAAWIDADFEVHDF